MKTEITSIKLKLADREIELSAQEARAVYEELVRLFAFERVDFPLHPVPILPIIIERETPRWPHPWTLQPWCGDPLPGTGLHGNWPHGTLCMAIGGR